MIGRGVWRAGRMALVAILLTGCANPFYDRGEPTRSRPSSPAAAHAIRPVVAVTAFENRANFTGQWELGAGIADMMIERLMRSDEVVVLERQHLDGVLSEIMRQGRDLFRREGRVERGRLKNARYLIRGTITDFTVTGDTSGWFSAGGMDAGVRSTRTRVGLYVTVLDVETGQIVSSVRTEGTGGSSRMRGSLQYQNLAFGGDAYFRTPLGRATQTALDRAVRRILNDIPAEQWEPRVAEGGIDAIIVNGGINVGLQTGQRFAVREEGRRITDPVTGDVIERIPGRIIGHIRITAVHATAAQAELLDGKAQRSDFLERIFE